MVIARRDGRLTMVRHPDHAALCGVLARAWRDVPGPVEGFVHACAHHDDAWHGPDSQPRHHPSEPRPMHFIELPIDEHPGFYGPVARDMAADDPYASLLVGMHWVGLYRGRWGMHPSPPPGPPEAERLKDEMIAAEDERGVRLRRELWGGEGLRSDFEAVAWHHYELLQVLDLVSLALCLVDLETPSEGDPAPVPRTLPGFDQPSGPRLIGAVPLGRGRVELRLEVVGEEQVAIDPWPFAQDAVDIEVPQRTIEDRPYETAEELSEAYAAASDEPRRARLQPRP